MRKTAVENKPESGCVQKVTASGGSKTRSLGGMSPGPTTIIPLRLFPFCGFNKSEKFGKKSFKENPVITGKQQ